MSLTLEEFVSDSSAPEFTTETALDSKIPLAQNHAKSGESIEETTRKIFEKIIQAKNIPAQKQAKKKKTLLAKRTQEEKERTRLAKEHALKEQLAKEKQLEEEAENRKKSLLASEKKKQEMLATQQALQEQERLAKEKEKQTTKEQATKALTAEKLAKKNQEKRRREKIKKEALQKAKAQKKAKLAQKEALKKRKEKVEKQKLVAQKRAKQKLLKKRALEKKLAKKRAAKKSTKGKTSKQGQSKYTNSTMGRSTQQMIHKFYGDEFSHFTGTQQKFIEKNLGNIYVITQRILSHKGYPFKAKQRHQQGIQLVTFYLHPNGHISKLKFLQRTKYKVLNDNTLKIIRFAHQKYPKPKTTTKITFFVVYTLH